MADDSDNRSTSDQTDPADASIGELLRHARPTPRAEWQNRAPHTELLGGGVKLPIGDVEIVRRLGGGSMGTVYEATHAGTSVALKALNQLSPQQLYCLKKEFRTLASVSHPNVISAYQLFGDQESWYFTMELVAGAPLHVHWREHATGYHGVTQQACYTPAHDAPLRRLLQQLIEDVVATHRAGLVHRDLKPANVLVEANGRLVIVDFGLVSEQHAGGIGQTMERSIAGTPAYMAPEQAQGLPASAASDWYAVGVILYELLTGRLPHRGSTEEVLRAKQTSVPRSPAEFVPAVAPDLDELCIALLNPRPELRPSSDDMLALSRSWQVQKPSTLREQAPPDRLEHFVGRRELLARLDEAFREARTRGPIIVLVTGDSGIGKSALLTHFVAGLQRMDDTFVLQGRCNEQESVPHKAFDGIIDQLTRILLRLPPEQALQLAPRHVYALTRLFPVLLRVPCFREAAENAKPAADSAQLRRHGYEALRELLCRIADRRSLALLIDDLHWGDDDSLRLLIDVLTPPDAARLLLLATHRPEAAARFEQLFDDCFDTRRFQLSKLSEAEACSLAATILDGAVEHTSAIARTIAVEAEGLPLYVIELARSFGERGNGGARSLDDLLRNSIECLRPEPRSAFELIAAAGRPLSRALLASASGLSDLHEPLAVLRKARLVRARVDAAGDEFLESYHQRVGKACVSLMSAERLRECRAQLAEAQLAAAQADPEWLSELYFAIGERAKAASHALQAGHLANTALAFHRAAEMFGRALECFDASTSNATRAEVYELSARALANVGRSAEAAQAFSRAAALTESHGRMRLESAANRQWMRSGHLEQAVSGLQRVLARLGIAWPHEQRELVVKLLFNRARIRVSRLRFELTPREQVPPSLIDRLDALHPAQTALGMFDYLRGAYFASLALPLALRAGDARHLVTSLMSESVYSAMLSGTRGREHSERVRRELAAIAPAVSPALASAILKLAAAMGAYWEGRWAEVGELANAAADGFSSEVPDGAWEAALARSVRSTVSAHTGQLYESRAELAAAARDAGARNDKFALFDVKRSLATTYLMADDAERAGHTLHELERELAEIPLSPMHVLMTSSFVAYHLYTGQDELARERFAAGHRKSAELGFLRFPLLRLMFVGMRADCTVSDGRASPRRVASELRELAREAAQTPIAWAPALASSLRAQAGLLVGHRDAGETEAARAIAGFERQGMHVDAAVERLRLVPFDSKAARDASLASLRGFGFATPARWLALARALY